MSPFLAGFSHSLLIGLAILAWIAWPFFAGELLARRRESRANLRRRLFDGDDDIRGI